MQEKKKPKELSHCLAIRDITSVCQCQVFWLRIEWKHIDVQYIQIDIHRHKKNNMVYSRIGYLYWLGSNTTTQLNVSRGQHTAFINKLISLQYRALRVKELGLRQK